MSCRLGNRYLGHKNHPLLLYKRSIENKHANVAVIAPFPLDSCRVCQHHVHHVRRCVSGRSVNDHTKEETDIVCASFLLLTHLFIYILQKLLYRDTSGLLDNRYHRHKSCLCTLYSLLTLAARSATDTMRWIQIILDNASRGIKANCTRFSALACTIRSRGTTISNIQTRWYLYIAKLIHNNNFYQQYNRDTPDILQY